MAAYKTAVDTGEGKPSFNGLAFASEQEAKDYGSDLASRWMAVRKTWAELFPNETPTHSYSYSEGLKSIQS